MTLLLFPGRAAGDPRCYRKTAGRPCATGSRRIGRPVAPAGTTTPNTGHHHLLVDSAALPRGTVVPVSEKSIHYGKGQTEADVTLPPGDHTLTAQFANGAHQPYGPEWSQTITVHVK